MTDGFETVLPVPPPEQRLYIDKKFPWGKMGMVHSANSERVAHSEWKIGSLRFHCATSQEGTEIVVLDTQPASLEKDLIARTTQAAATALNVPFNRSSSTFDQEMRRFVEDTRTSLKPYQDFRMTGIKIYPEQKLARIATVGPMLILQPRFTHTDTTVVANIEQVLQPQERLPENSILSHGMNIHSLRFSENTGLLLLSDNLPWEEPMSTILKPQVIHAFTGPTSVRKCLDLAMIDINLSPTIPREERFALLTLFT